VRSLLGHLDNLPVFNLVLTLTAISSPYPPLAAQPTNQLKFNTKRHSTTYGCDASLAIKYNQVINNFAPLSLVWRYIPNQDELPQRTHLQWLSKGNFIPELLAAFLQQGERHPAELTENAAAVLVEILATCGRHISKGLEAPLILSDLMEESTLTNFISSVLAHKVFICAPPSNPSLNPYNFLLC